MSGIAVKSSASLNTISNNYIGINSLGTVAIPNNSKGIYIENANSNVIQSNVVSGNGEEGIYVYNISERNLIKDTN